MTTRIVTGANGIKYITNEPFKPDYDTQAVLVEEMQRMAKQISEMKDWEAVAADQAMTIAMMKVEQEPVAWMTINEYGEEDDIHYENPEGHLLEGWTYKPLYTHPPTAQTEKEPVALDRRYTERLIEALEENSDPVSCDAAEEFRRLLTSPPKRQPLSESMIKAGLDELEAIRQTELVGDYELIKRLLEAAHGIGDKT